MLTSDGVSTFHLGAKPTAPGGLFEVGSGGAGSFTVDGNYSQSDPLLDISGSSSHVTINTSASGTSAVQLPHDAIDASEIMDEPGIAQNRSADVLEITSTTEMQDVLTVTITIPTSGYITLDCAFTIGMSNTVSISYQLDEDQGGPIDPAYYEECHCKDCPSDIGGYTTTMRRTYYKFGADSHTFRLEAMKGAGSGYAGVYRPTLIATFFPTSYGSVITTAAAAEAATFQNVTWTRTRGFDGKDRGPAAQVDLRELELKAAKAEAEAERVGRELVEAKLRAQLEADGRKP
jgi:hypothetical protein